MIFLSAPTLPMLFSWTSDLVAIFYLPMKLAPKKKRLKLLRLNEWNTESPKTYRKRYPSYPDVKVLVLIRLEVALPKRPKSTDVFIFSAASNV